VPKTLLKFFAVAIGALFLAVVVSHDLDAVVQAGLRTFIEHWNYAGFH